MAINEDGMRNMITNIIFLPYGKAELFTRILLFPGNLNFSIECLFCLGNVWLISNFNHDCPLVWDIQ